MLPHSNSAKQMDDGRSALACPACRGGLVWSSSESRCETCARQFDIVDGIPILLASDLGAQSAQLIEGAGCGHVAGHGWLIDPPPVADQKQCQARFFDEEDAELEICRPHGQPAFYGWLLSEKLRRSVRGVGSLRGISAVTVCGGSGMDAEYLARCGASVTSIDISLGAARRTRERARRFGVSILSVVGDGERLPLDDRSIELAYVHDGLHHLPDPYAGLMEMTRVARRAVSITEPAQAAATAIAVKLGLALEQEEAGNRVGRMVRAETEALLLRSGFHVVFAERYAMYYHQIPGKTMRLISRRRVLPLATRGLQSLNRAAGTLGNKLTVQAVRTDDLTVGSSNQSQVEFVDGPTVSDQDEARCG